MERDLRKLLKDHSMEENARLKTGHEDRFLRRLESEIPLKTQPKKSRPFYLKMAATLAVIISVGGLLWNHLKETPSPVKPKDDKVVNVSKSKISLGDLSPDLKKIEGFYTTQINWELSELNLESDNKDLVDAYLAHMAELNQEYQRLNRELNEMGPNDQTISALVENLQLRLQLLYKLKDQLKQIKSSKNEKVETQRI